MILLGMNSWSGNMECSHRCCTLGLKMLVDLELPKALLRQAELYVYELDFSFLVVNTNL